MQTSFFDDESLFPSNNYQLCKKIRKEEEIDFSKKVLIQGELGLRPSFNLMTNKYFRVLDRKLVYFSVI